ncbi:neutral zinc metallopeptidase, partial [Saccharomonospora saliphila]|uniref:neutral zinc metallopeptidase n=1 Tax=Saccharomonospora saliphila TaxID=369829 RepID=UPI00037215EF
MSLLPALVAVGLVFALVVVVPARDGPGTTAAGGSTTETPFRDDPPTVAAIGDNPLHSSVVRPASVACELPEPGSAVSRLRAFYDALLRCLDRSWRPALDAAGARFGPARVSIADAPETACGPLPPSAEATGLYCSTDTTIYLPRSRTLDAFGLSVEAHVATLAHEYGHHVQHLSGILDDAGRMLGRYAEDGPADREIGRRVELQANCLAGTFLRQARDGGAFDRELAEAAVDDFRNWVDSDTHGAGDTQRGWALRGYRDGGAG